MVWERKYFLQLYSLPTCSPVDIEDSGCLSSEFFSGGSYVCLCLHHLFFPSLLQSGKGMEEGQFWPWQLTELRKAYGTDLVQRFHIWYSSSWDQTREYSFRSVSLITVRKSLLQILFGSEVLFNNPSSPPISLHIWQIWDFRSFIRR